MRVLHVGKYFPPFSGGIENFMFDLMTACTARQIAVMSVVHHHRPGVPTRVDRWPAGGGHVMDTVRVRTFGRILYAPVSPGFGRALEQAARDFKPDIVHVHMPNLSAFWLLRSQTLGRVPWVVHWHADVTIEDAPSLLALAYRAYHPLEQAVLRRAVRVIVTSPPYLHASEPLRRWHAKCVVIPLGLDVTHLTQTNGGEPSGDHATVGASSFVSRVALKLLFVGRLSAYKGLDFLVEGVADTDGVELVIAGEGDQKESIAALVRRLGLESRIRLVGRVNDAAKLELFRKADVICLPSTNRHEAFGLVLLEAMACGVPVIATRVPGSGMQWVVKDGKTGWLVEPRDAGAIAALLKRLAANPGLLWRAGFAAEREFRARFDIRAVTDAVIRVYRTMSQQASA